MSLVMIVEDDKVTMKILSTLIASMGHSALKFRNGRRAWEFIEDNGDIVDLVVTDLMMAEMNGEELIRMIRKNDATSEVPIIVQSAFLGVRGTSKLLDLGASIVVPKPIDSDDFREYVNTVLSDIPA